MRCPTLPVRSAPLNIRLDAEQLRLQIRRYVINEAPDSSPFGSVSREHQMDRNSRRFETLKNTHQAPGRDVFRNLIRSRTDNALPPKSRVDDGRLVAHAQPRTNTNRSHPAFSLPYRPKRP